MKYLLIALLAAVLITSASYGEINAKLGLAGGGAQLALEGVRALRPDISASLTAGYAYNSEYGLVSAALAIAKKIRPDLDIGIGLTYSSYSVAVQNLIGVSSINDKSGAGGKLFLKKQIRSNLFVEAGYDTRMGLLAEIGLELRK